MGTPLFGYNISRGIHSGLNSGVNRGVRHPSEIVYKISRSVGPSVLTGLCFYSKLMKCSEDRFLVATKENWRPSQKFVLQRHWKLCPKISSYVSATNRLLGNYSVKSLEPPLDGSIIHSSVECVFWSSFVPSYALIIILVISFCKLNSNFMYQCIPHRCFKVTSQTSAHSEKLSGS